MTTTIDPARNRTAPMRLSLREWLGLWWQGRVDGRRGLPGLPASGQPLATTPQVETLWRQVAELCETERLSELADLAALDQRDRQVQRVLAAAEVRLTTAHADLAAFERLPLDTGERRRGEDGLDVCVVSRRRRREHGRELARLRRRVRRARDEVGAAQQEAQQQSDLREQRAAESRARARQHADRAERRLALYWRALVRRHPDRAELSEQWAMTSAPLPAWAGGDER
jgi:hypothetical protein